MEGGWGETSELSGIPLGTHGRNFSRSVEQSEKWLKKARGDCRITLKGRKMDRPCLPQEKNSMNAIKTTCVLWQCLGSAVSGIDDVSNRGFFGCLGAKEGKLLGRGDLRYTQAKKLSNLKKRVESSISYFRQRRTLISGLKKFVICLLVL